MALLFMDSFDQYTTIVNKWTQIYTLGGSVNPAVTSGAGRRSSSCMRFGGNRDLRAIGKVFPLASGDTCIVGFAFRHSVNGFSDLATGTMDINQTVFSATGNGLLYMRQGGTAQVVLQINIAGQIKVYRGGTLIGTSAAALTHGIYQYIECKAVISDTVGSVTIHVDGVPFYSLTGVDTKQTAFATWDEIAIGQLHANSAFCYWDFDDLYVCDGTGAIRNGFLGDCGVYPTFPNANGSNSGSTPSTGTDRYATVDEADPNGDTDYNTLASAGDKDTLNFPTAPVAAATIFGIQSNVYAKKVDVGTATLRHVTRVGGTEYYGTGQGVPTDYAILHNVWAVNPADSADWEDTDYNAAEFGYEKET